MKNENKVVTSAQSLEYANWQQADLAIILTGDIRHPWKSVYGFSMIAAQLAAGQPLLLHSREDEVFDLLAKLNELLGDPDSLNQAHKLLKKLEQETRQKVSSLIEVEQQSLTVDATAGVLEVAEQILTQPSRQSKADRLADILSPDQPGQEISGKSKMLARLQVLIPALEKVKDKGYHVVVFDKRRKPIRRPANQETAAGLMPVQYHLTLWSYLVVRNDNGQSAGWN
jgi:hypothetical protein